MFGFCQRVVGTLLGHLTISVDAIVDQLQTSALDVRDPQRSEACNDLLRGDIGRSL